MGNSNTHLQQWEEEAKKKEAEYEAKILEQNEILKAQQKKLETDQKILNEKIAHTTENDKIINKKKSDLEKVEIVTNNKKAALVKKQAELRKNKAITLECEVILKDYIATNGEEKELAKKQLSKLLEEEKIAKIDCEEIKKEADNIKAEWCLKRDKNLAPEEALQFDLNPNNQGLDYLGIQENNQDRNSLSGNSQDISSPRSRSSKSSDQ